MPDTTNETTDIAEVSANAVLDAASLASVLRAALEGVTLQLDGEAVGRLVAPVVDRELGLTLRAGRFA